MDKTRKNNNRGKISHGSACNLCRDKQNIPEATKERKKERYKKKIERDWMTQTNKQI